MAECTVCGKNGLFLFVNKTGRCKSCEEAYQKEQNKLRRIEEERLALIEKEKTVNKIFYDNDRRKAGVKSAFRLNLYTAR